MGVCVGVISAGSVELECAQSIVALVVTKAAEWAWFQRIGPYLDDGRNSLIQIFNQQQFTKCDRLLMVDSDIGFDPDNVRQLAEDDLPIVSGVYHSQYSQGIQPVVYGWAELPDGRRTLTPAAGWRDGPWDGDYSNPIIEVDAVGAGFLMLRRDALDAFAARYEEPCPWFAEDVIGGIHFGEDLCFCIRAAELGIPVCVDRRVQVAHHKHVRLGGRQQVPVEA